MRDAQTRYQLLKQTLQKYDAAIRKSAGQRASDRDAKPSTRTASTQAELISEIVAKHGSLGVTGRDVFSILSGKGSAASLNAVHAALSKMKEARLMTVKAGKYFPTDTLVKLYPTKRTLRTTDVTS